MENKDINLFEKFMHVQRLFMRYSHQKHHEHGMHKYRGQGRVLKLLKMQPEISQKDLVEILGMRPQSLGELLSKLEDKGLITRTLDENDKRAMIVKITEEGRKVSEQAKMMPDTTELFAALTDEEKANLEQYLSRMIEELNKKIDKDAPEFQGHHHKARY